MSVLAGSLLAFVVLLSVPPAWAQPPKHRFYPPDLPPGVIGQQQVIASPSRRGYFQPVQIKLPEGARVSLAADGAFGQAEKSPVAAAMMVGQVYRFQVTSIPGYEGFELFPSVEVLDRLCPPPGQEANFPIPVEITQDEIEYALRGYFVTRVIYLENPETALPQAQQQHQHVIDVRSDDDPVAIADELGRPMAILRIGSRVPDIDQVTGRFSFGMPPLIRLPKIEAAAKTYDADYYSSAIERQTRDIPRIPLKAQQPTSVRISGGRLLR